MEIMLRFSFAEIGSPRERHSYRAEQVLDILLSDDEGAPSDCSSGVSNRYRSFLCGETQYTAIHTNYFSNWKDLHRSSGILVIK